MNKTQKTYINAMQKKSFEIFEIFRAVCEAHDIQYFAAAGTALGTVRHKGFIPWDDDIDICMPRPEYLRLVTLLRRDNVLPDGYEFTDHMLDPYGGIVFGKIVDTRSTNIPNFVMGRPELYTGMSMDIFPLDGVPSSTLLFKPYIFMMTLLRMTKKTLAFGSFYSQYSPRYEKSRKNIFMRTFCAIIPKRLITALFNKFASAYDYDSERTKYVTYVYAFTQGHGSIPFSRFLKKDFLDYVDMPFEKTTIHVPVGYDQYLTASYGDYMELPPEGSRVPPHSDGIVDTKFPYSYYQALHRHQKIGYLCVDDDIPSATALKGCRRLCDYLVLGVSSRAIARKILPKLQSEGLVDFIYENAPANCCDEYHVHPFDKLFVEKDYEMWQELFKKKAPKVEVLRFEQTHVERKMK